MNRIPRVEYFMTIAKVVGLRSTCPRAQVGCVLVSSRNHIIATGYNGVPMDMPHCIDTPCGGDQHVSLDLCYATHAEQNALLQCPDVHQIATCYCTRSPCFHCVKLLMNTSCELLVYEELYDVQAINLWKESGKKHQNIPDTITIEWNP